MNDLAMQIGRLIGFAVIFGLPLYLAYRFGYRRGADSQRRVVK